MKQIGVTIIMKALVAFFSASGVTKKVAERLAKMIKADIFEIEPEIVYTTKDLDWMDKNSRSSVEMADKASRPGIKNKVVDMESYDTVYLGFPIWWYVAPTIINTFLESYNFKGKKVIIFATSGGSDFGHTLEGLEDSCNASVLTEGKVIKANASDEEIKSIVIE